MLTAVFDGKDVAFLEARVVGHSAGSNGHIVIFRFSLVIERPRNLSVGNACCVNFAFVNAVARNVVGTLDGFFTSDVNR